MTIEVLPSWATLIFTTTAEAQEQLLDARLDASAFLSPCVVIPLSRRDLSAPFAERAREMAQREGLNGRDRLKLLLEAGVQARDAPVTIDCVRQPAVVSRDAVREQTPDAFAPLRRVLGTDRRIVHAARRVLQMGL